MIFRKSITSKTIARGWGLALFAILVGACGNGSSVGTTTGGRTAVRLAVYSGSIYSMPLFIASKQGFFTRNGLDVSLVPVSSGPNAMAAMAGGSVDSFSASPEIVLPAVARGLPFRLFAGVTKLNWELMGGEGTTSGAYPDVIKQLRGKKLGIVALGSNSQAIAEAMLQDAGLSGSDVTFVAVGLGATAASSLEGGQVQAVVTVTPAVPAILASGKGKVLVDLRDPAIGPTYLRGKDYVAQWANASFIAEHPTVITALRKSLAQADLWMHDKANFGAVKRVFADVLGGAVPDALLDKEVTDNLPILTSEYSRDALSAFIAFDVKYGFLKNPLDLSKLYAPGTPEDLGQVQAAAK